MIITIEDIHAALNGIAEAMTDKGIEDPRPSKMVAYWVGFMAQVILEANLALVFMATAQPLFSMICWTTLSL